MFFQIIDLGLSLHLVATQDLIPDSVPSAHPDSTQGTLRVQGIEPRWIVDKAGSKHFSLLYFIFSPDSHYMYLFLGFWF